MDQQQQSTESPPPPEQQQQQRKKRILVSNDDGIDAPGLRAIVSALVQRLGAAAEVFVCAPSEERSGMSHAISLARFLSCHPRDDVDGATAAFAVDGTPADCVMLALHSPLFRRSSGGGGGGDSGGGDGASTGAIGSGGNGNTSGNSGARGGNRANSSRGAGFDLVVSGINRGDNCGLHIIYSGTVGAAREAACKGVPSLALSLDAHGARRVDDYAASAKLGAALAAALLEVLEEAPAALPDVAEGLVLNVNVPRGALGGGGSAEGGSNAGGAGGGGGGGGGVRGVRLTHQGTGTFYPEFREVAEGAGPHLPEIELHTEATLVFRNFAGGYREDGTAGSDMRAVADGWASVTPLGLRSDLLFKTRAALGGGAGGGAGGGSGVTTGVSAAQERHARGSVAVAAQVVARAAAALGMVADGIADVEWPLVD